MNIFKVPKNLHEVFGEHQTGLEVGFTLCFAVLGCYLIYVFHFPTNTGISGLLVILGFLLVGDILAGCIANFTRGTNDYYANRSKSRWIFIGIHFHIIAIAWLLDGPLIESFVVWGFTIASASIVNVLKNHRNQLFISANLVGLGLFLVSMLEIPMWFTITSLFFIVKVVLSFAVDHYPNEPQA